MTQTRPINTLFRWALDYRAYLLDDSSKLQFSHITSDIEDREYDRRINEVPPFRPEKRCHNYRILTTVSNGFSCERDPVGRRFVTVPVFRT